MIVYLFCLFLAVGRDGAVSSLANAADVPANDVNWRNPESYSNLAAQFFSRKKDIELESLPLNATYNGAQGTFLRADEVEALNRAIEEAKVEKEEARKRDTLRWWKKEAEKPQVLESEAMLLEEEMLEDQPGSGNFKRIFRSKDDPVVAARNVADVNEIKSSLPSWMKKGLFQDRVQFEMEPGIGEPLPILEASSFTPQEVAELKKTNAWRRYFGKREPTSVQEIPPEVLLEARKETVVSRGWFSKKEPVVAEYSASPLNALSDREFEKEMRRREKEQAKLKATEDKELKTLEKEYDRLTKQQQQELREMQREIELRQKGRQSDLAAIELERSRIAHEEEMRRQAELAEAERLRYEEEQRRKKEEKSRMKREEKERYELEKAEKKRLEKEAKERYALESAEQKRLEKEARQRYELEQAEKKRLDKERREAEKVEKMRLEKEAKERRALEKEQQKRLELEAKSRLELDKSERKRLEKEAKAKLELENAERKRLEKEAKAKLELESAEKRMEREVRQSSLEMEEKELNSLLLTVDTPDKISVAPVLNEGRRIDHVFFDVLPGYRRDGIDFNESSNSYTVDVYQNEPVVVGAYSRDNVFVDHNVLGEQYGGVSRHAFGVIIPRGAVGTFDTYQLHCSNPERSLVDSVKLNAHVVPSVSPKIQSLRVTRGGRLDPQFSPSRYSYYVRMAPFKKHLTFDLKMMNDREAWCSIDGNEIIKGTGKFHISLPAGYQNKVIVMKCHNHDRSSSVNYIFNVIPQRGASTLLQSLDVLGGPFNHRFDPFYGGPYVANLLQGARRDDAQEIEWMAIRAIPRNRDAIVFIEGQPIDRTTHLSPWYRIPRGEQRLFRIDVKSPDNPVTEEYYVIGSRSYPGMKFYETTSGVYRVGSILKWLTSAVTAHTGADFIHNQKYLQSMSFGGAMHGVPELYSAYSAGGMTWTPQCVAKHITYYNSEFPFIHSGNCSRGSLCPMGYDGKALLPYKFALVDEELRNRATFEDGTNALDMLYGDGTWATTSGKRRLSESEIYSIANSEAETFKIMDYDGTKQAWVPTEVDKDLVRGAVIRVLADIDDEIELKEAVEESKKRKKFFKREAKEEVKKEVVETELKKEIVGEPVVVHSKSAPLTMYREDLTFSAIDSQLSSAERLKIVSVVETGRRENEYLVKWAETLVGFTAMLLAASAGYALLWFTYLRDPMPGDFYPLNLRQDCPAILHPTRFWSFLLDLSVINYGQAVFGFMSADKRFFTHAEIFGLRMSLSALRILAWCTFIIMPVAFIGCGLYVLIAIRKYMVYSTTMCCYHDDFAPSAKAEYTFPWLKYVPFIRNLFKVEIRNALPIVKCRDDAVFDPEDRHVYFVNNPAMMIGGNYFSADPSDAVSVVAGLSGYSPVASNMSTSSLNTLYDTEGIRSSLKDARVRVAIDADAFTEAENKIIVANSLMYEKYPHSKAGYSKMGLYNAYGSVVNVDAELECQYVSPLMRIADQPFRFPIWVPKGQLDFAFHGMWKLFLHRAQKNNYFYWAIDRIAMLIVIAGFAFGRTRYPQMPLILAMGVAATVSAISIPGALSAGGAKWMRLMEERAQELKEMEAILANDAEAALLRAQNKTVGRSYYDDNLDRTRSSDGLSKFPWPYSDKQNLEAHLMARKRMQARLQWGAYPILHTYFVDPIRRGYYSSFWDTRFWVTLKEFARGPCGTEFLKSGVLLGLFLGNRLKLSSTSHGLEYSWACIFLSWITFFCVDMDSMKKFFHECHLWGRDVWELTEEYLVRFISAMTEYREIPSRMSYYGNEAISMVTTKGKKASFHYPKIRTIFRDCTAKTVTFVTPEAGIHMTGRVVKSRNGAMKRRNLDPLSEAQRRDDLYKTLVVNGDIGAHRPGLLRNVPITIPYTYYCPNEEIPPPAMERLVATIQVVNHGVRASSAGLKPLRDSKHDSFLSLFADPVHFPAPGEIRLREMVGHSVRYNAENDLLVIRGPQIIGGRRYSVRTRNHPLAEDLSSGSSSSSHIGQRGHGECICTRPGRLRVRVPEGLKPDLYRRITVETPNHAQVVVDPNVTKATYDPVYRRLTLNAREFIPHDSPYTVIWQVLENDCPKIAGTGIAEHGCLRIELPREVTPDLNCWLTVTDIDSKECINIDASQTDKYCFIPSHGASVNTLMATVSGRFKYWWNYVSGRRTPAAVLEELIPCTVIQCVDPVRKVYRLDPNFNELHRVQAGIVQVLEATLASIDLPGQLPRLWSEYMLPAQYAELWRSCGLDIVKANGELMDPLDCDEAAFESSTDVYKSIAQGENTLKMTLREFIQVRILELQNSLEKTRLLVRAYNDPELYAAQMEKDVTTWNLRHSADLDAQISRLREIKEKYQRQASMFFYPCNASASSIVKKPNLEAQFKDWMKVINRWFAEQEGCSELMPEYMRRNVKRVMEDIKLVLNQCLMRVEVPNTGVYRSILHYVVGSHVIKGPNAPWRPDPIAAYNAMVRCWEVGPDGLATYNMKWNLCRLKLGGGDMQILIPAGPKAVDTDYHKNLRYPWKKVFGFSIPLIAFQKFEVIYDDTVPTVREGESAYDADCYALLPTMRWRLVCHKNMFADVKDNYVKRLDQDPDVPGDELFNILHYNDAENEAKEWAYELLLGRSEIPLSDVHMYPGAEQEVLVDGARSCCFPLSFRIGDEAAEMWRRVILMAQMDRPHGFEFREEIVETKIIDQVVTKPNVDEELLEAERRRAEAAALEERRRREQMERERLAELERLRLEAEKLARLQAESAITTPPITEVIQTTEISSGGSSPHDYLFPQQIDGLYKGDMKDGRFDGQGELSILDPSIDDASYRCIYKGGFSRGLRHGVGICQIVDEDGVLWAYEGRFENDQIVGPGVLEMIDDRERARLKTLDSPKALRRPIRYDGSLSAPRAVAPRVVDPLPQEYLTTALIDERTYKLNLSAIAYYSATDQDVRRTIMQMGDADPSSSLNAAVTSSILNATNSYTPYKTIWRNNDKEVFLRLDDGILTYADGYMFKGPCNRSVVGEVEAEAYHCRVNAKYRGLMNNGSPNGVGVMEFGDEGKEGTRYYGNLVNGARHGEGLLLARDGMVYLAGNWSQDMVSDGPIDLVLNPGLKKSLQIMEFNGNLVGGKPEGPCRVVYPDGMVYEGMFRGGKRNGQGIIRDLNGLPIFEGTLEGDVPHGRCSRWVLPDGCIYCGETYRGTRHGNGQLYKTPAGQKLAGKLLYEGLWQNDIPHGRGTYYGADGEYDGEWRMGKRHGKGRITFIADPLANGRQRVYEGDWRDDKPEGVGKYLSEAGTDNVYKVSNGKLVENSIDEYKPFCGHAPEVGKGPVVVATGFTQSHDEKMFGRKKLMSPEGFVELIKSIIADDTWLKTENSRTCIALEGERYPFVSISDGALLRPARPTPAVPLAISTVVPGSEIIKESMPIAKDEGMVSRFLNPRPGDKPLVKIHFHEGRNIDTHGSHISGHADPYLIVKYGAQEKKFPDKKFKSGNVKFNDECDFIFNPSHNNIVAEVWDKDTMRKDDKMGEAIIEIDKCLKEMRLTGGNKFEGEARLHRTPKKGGAPELVGTLYFQLFIEIGPAAAALVKTGSSGSSLQSGIILAGPHVKVSVHSVTELKGERSSIDPFIKVTIGSHVRQTGVGEGVNSKFDETFIFPYERLDKILFEVWDKDRMRKDDLCGKVDYDLAHNPRYSGNLPLINKKGQPAGLLDVTITLNQA